MPSRRHDEIHEERRVAGRAIRCGCPSFNARAGEHSHPECVGTIKKGEVYLHWGSLNPALYSGKNFCMPCARAVGVTWVW